MPRPISEDQVRCLEEAKRKGLSRGEASKLCGVGTTTVQRYWSEMERQQGADQPQPGEPRPLVRRVEPEERRFTGTGISEVMRTLGREYSEILKVTLEKTAWFNKALVEVGWISTLMAFQYARVDPKDVARKVEEFKDPENFVDFVVRHLQAMLQASADAVKAIIERDERIEFLDRVVQELAERAKSYRRAARNISLSLGIQLEAARIVLSRYNLLQEYLTTLAELGVAIPTPSVPQAQEVSEGGSAG